MRISKSIRTVISCGNGILGVEWITISGKYCQNATEEFSFHSGTVNGGREFLENANFCAKTQNRSGKSRITESFPSLFFGRLLKKELFRLKRRARGFTVRTEKF